MKRRVLYLVLAVIAAGIVSFTKVTGEHNKQPLPGQAIQPIPGVAVEYNNNGSTRQITWHESDTALYVKTFTYQDKTVTITEKLNNKLIKEETGELNNGMLTGIKGKLFSNDGIATATYAMDYQYNDEGQTLRVMYGNGNRHDYVYDARKNLVETNWYNHQGDIMVTAKKQYFPKLPDAYTVYHRMADSTYAGFVPAFNKKSSAYTRMSDKVKNRISFDGKYSYIMDMDGYLLSY